LTQILSIFTGRELERPFINKLDMNRSNFPLDLIRVFTFLLNLDLDYKSIPSLYAPSPFSSLWCSPHNNLLSYKFYL